MTNLFSLTEKEIQFLEAFTQSDFFEEGIDSVVWDYSVHDNLPYSGKTRSGVISSLSQKNVLVVSLKEKGEIAGTYHLTKEAKTCELIQSICNRN
ncbi:gp120 [Sphingomonas phage PAU]|uniref:gp120 n=1 Tax=Sphingomonas phage PAU TaxID=1150991 RepID=UPI000257326B|nr:gp120 [Sphingomonas phage PAU]AFF28118.1 gp120 [Sphingomonas phage PAU]